MVDKKGKKAYNIVVGISVLIVAIFIFRIWCDGLNIWHKGVDYAITGQVGDFIGGVIGTIFSAAGFYLLYRTLEEQRTAINNQKDSFEKERFEAKFFDLIRLHKENVSEQKYMPQKEKLIEGRKVFLNIQRELQECISEIKRFCKIYNSQNYVKKKYKNKLKKIITTNNLKVNINELAIIDIAYTIVFYGVGKEGQILVKNKFLKKYNDDFYFHLLRFIQLKPNQNNNIGLKKWEDFKNQKVAKLKSDFNEIYANRKNKNYTFLIDNYNLIDNYKHIKFYGGHQHRLGHYYRHLFQAYKFVYTQRILDDSEKYFYGKILRAQLSNYEQSLLFINSITSFGYKWELDPEVDYKNNPIKLITFFQLIKNVTGRRLIDIDFRNFYPQVKYEFED